MKRHLVHLLALLGLLALAHSGRAESVLLAQVWTADGVETGGQFAYAAAGIGDVNGDGYDDVAVGAPRVEPDGGPYRAGAAFVYRGGPGGLPLAPTWSGGGSETGVRFGHVVAGAGDVNGDSYADFLVSAYRENQGYPEAGAVYLFHGSAVGLRLDPDWQAFGDRSGAQFGFAAAGAGDVNGDGYDDVLIGARWYSTAESNLGAVYLYHGSAAGLSAQPAWHFVGSTEMAALGSAVAGAGDVNGDGFDDVLIGAPYHVDLYADEGLAIAFYGSTAGLGPAPSWAVEGGEADALLGSAVAGAGDVNGDGYADVVVGAPQAAGSDGATGAARLYYGAAQGLGGAPGWVAHGTHAPAGFGVAVNSAGDVNFDGYDDLVVGAHRYSGDQYAEGAAFVFLGGPRGPRTTPDWHAEGNKAETQFGFAVASAGDFNDDGYADLVVGAPFYRLSEILVGRAFAYQGAESPLIFRTHLPALPAAGG